MSGNNFTYKSQDVNYLGFLEAQLRDLLGIATLAYELIQNADDVETTTWLTFDVTDEALIVTNDGLFRPIDFERLQSVASGGKREEVGTTGAFGLGFLAIYQVTDAPEIFSSGIHWVIQPDAPPERRIRERQVATEGTRFYLPWATDPTSIVRRTLRIDAVQPAQLDDFAVQIAAALETAALFLQRLRVLEVRRSGSVVRRITREAGMPHEIILREVDGTSVAWMLYRASFADEAEQLRAQYPWQIEPGRRSEVRLAIPEDGLAGPGRLFAVLPTDSTTPLPFHINADFFPTTDRKRIHFGSSYQAAWNQAAIKCGARLLAQNLDELAQRLGPVRLWDLLLQLAEAAQLAVQGRLPSVFTAFWQEAVSRLANLPLMFTARGAWSTAAEVRLVEMETAVPLLNALSLPIVHSDLIPYFPLMRRPEIGAVNLSIDDLAAALRQAGLDRATPLYAAPDGLRSLDAWQALWTLIDTLLDDLPHPRARDAALQTLRLVALVLTRDMTLVRLGQVYRGKTEAAALFPELDWLHELVPLESFPGRWVTQFGVRQAVDLLAETPAEQLEAAWRAGRLDIPRLFRWFESQPIEIFGDDPALQKEIRRLPLCPVGGELRPLDQLFIPGGFEDPLDLAGVVYLEEMGGRPQFLRDLGVSELDFETYVHVFLPRALAQDPDLPSDARHRLAQLLAERLGELRDDETLQEQLRRLPLIACMDGSFRAAQETYASRDVMALLGDRVHIAEPVESGALLALHRWLGVRQEPAAADLVQALQASVTRGGDDAPEVETVTACWKRLDALLAQGRVAPMLLATLRDYPVMPNRRGYLRKPVQLFLLDHSDAAAEFADLDSYVPARGFEQAAAAACVRALSEMVALEIVDMETAVPDATLTALIGARLPLIERVLRADVGRDESTRQVARLGGLRALRLPRLRVGYRLALDDRVLQTMPQPAAVKLVLARAEEPARLFVDEGVAWTAVARELALALLPAGTTSGLALGIKEVLAAESASAAAQTLDELGYP